MQLSEYCRNLKSMVFKVSLRNCMWVTICPWTIPGSSLTGNKISKSCAEMSVNSMRDLKRSGKDISCLEDVYFWKNPRKHEVRWRVVNGKREKYVVSDKAVDGEQLYKSLCTIRDRYNVRFEFCEKKETGERIVELLSGCHD